MEINQDARKVEKKLKSAHFLMPKTKLAKKILNERAKNFSIITVEKIEKENLAYIKFTLGPNKEHYGIPYSCAKEVIHNIIITKIPNSAACIAGVINYRGIILTVVDLKYFFYNIKSEENKEHYLIIVNEKNITLGLLIDSIDGSDVYDPSFIEAPLPSQGTIRPEYISGIHKGVTAIIDVENLMGAIQLQVKSMEKTQ